MAYNNNPNFINHSYKEPQERGNFQNDTLHPLHAAGDGFPYTSASGNDRMFSDGAHRDGGTYAARAVARPVSPPTRPFSVVHPTNAPFMSAYAAPEPSRTPQVTVPSHGSGGFKFPGDRSVLADDNGVSHGPTEKLSRVDITNRQPGLDITNRYAPLAFTDTTNDALFLASDHREQSPDVQVLATTPPTGEWGASGDEAAPIDVDADRRPRTPEEAEHGAKTGRRPRPRAKSSTNTVEADDDDISVLSSKSLQKMARKGLIGGGAIADTTATGANAADSSNGSIAMSEKTKKKLGVGNVKKGGKEEELAASKPKTKAQDKGKGKSKAVDDHSSAESGEEKGRKRKRAPKKKQKKGRQPGATNFRKDDTAFLLDLIAEILPLGERSWNRVVAEYNAKYATPNGRRERDYDSLRQKFTRLVKTKKPTGTAKVPAEVLAAKDIYEQILEKSNTKTIDDGDDTDFDPINSGESDGSQSDAEDEDDNSESGGSSSESSGAKKTKRHKAATTSGGAPDAAAPSKAHKKAVATSGSTSAPKPKEFKATRVRVSYSDQEEDGSGSRSVKKKTVVRNLMDRLDSHLNRDNKREDPAERSALVLDHFARRDQERDARRTENREYERLTERYDRLEERFATAMQENNALRLQQQQQQFQYQMQLMQMRFGAQSSVSGTSSNFVMPQLPDPFANFNLDGTPATGNSGIGNPDMSSPSLSSPLANNRQFM